MKSDMIRFRHSPTGDAGKYKGNNGYGGFDKMGDSRFTILIVPSDRSELRKFKVKSKYISYGIILLAILCTLGVGTILHYLKVARQAQAVEKVQKENATLRASLEKSEILAQKLNRKISALSRLSVRLKAITGLTQPILKTQDESLSKFGMGGVSFSPAPDAGQLMVLEKRAEMLEQNLKGLQSYIQTEKPFSTPSMSPAAGFISSSFGSRLNPFTSLPDFHEGVDICNDYGTPVHATAQGKVIHAGSLGSFGQTIEIEHENGITTLYGHLSKIYVKVGQEVQRGEKIALMGNSGMSTGPHVHYEVLIHDQPVNPRPYLTRRGG
jgi:murein DD-endopeptidase MepM/ murein hydrolase activator NlpD